MKTWPLCAFTLLAAVLVSASANAQAPSGVARVDSDTYFDTANASWGYHNQQNNFAEYSGDSYRENNQSSRDVPSFTGASQNNGGLLGKRYIRSAYVFYGLDVLEKNLEGFDVELNTPNPWIDDETFGSDFFVEIEHRGLTETVASNGNRLELDQDLVILGTRLYAFPKSRFRPYVALGVGFDRFESETRIGATTTRTKSNDSALVTNLGFELDLSTEATNASIRGDFELNRAQLDESFFEGVLIVWLHESVFLRGGVAVPLSDGFSPGATIGAGIGF